MVKWEVLDADCDEETRQAGDLSSLTSLYEVVKLAYLQSDSLLVDVPQFFATAAWGRVAVALDSTIFVFGEGCSSLLMQLAVEVPIDLVLWIPQGDFLILGDNAGGVHWVHVQSKKVLISKQFPVKNASDKLFVGGGSRQADDGSISVSLITYSGHVIRMENIDAEGLCDDLRMDNIENLKSLEEQMTLSVDNMSGVEASTAACVDNNTWIWCGGKEGVTLWMPLSLQDPSQSFTWHLALNSECRRVIPICNNRYVVVLDTTGKLMVLCGVTGLILWEGAIDDPPISDIALVQGDEHNTQFLLLLRNPDSKGCLLRIVSFPEFSTVYELVVDNKTKLVNMSEGAESIMFLEPDINCDSSASSSLKLKSIVDGVPEARLAKLLMKRKFKEAEAFCSRFGLNIEEVHQARAKFLCDLMNPWNTSAPNITINEMEGSGELTEELLLTLEKIHDAEFVTFLCIVAPLPDLITTKKILNYAKERLTNSAQSEKGDHLSSLMQRVSENTYRLRTFETIFPTSDIQHWLAFSHTNMLDEFIEHLSRGNLDVASTVWHRHQFEFSHQVDQACVSKILAAFPHSIPSQTLCIWLPRNVLSDLVKFCPSSLEIIANWGDSRVKCLEVLEKAMWPSNGLVLANTIISVLENVAADFHAGGNIEVQMAVHVAQWKAHSPSSDLYHLRQTAVALQDLQLLANEFRIKIEFNQYIQENKESVVAALFDWLVCGEEVSPLMDGFLQSFMIRHELDYDSTLSRYVMDTLASADQDWWAWQEAPWEDKLYAIIHVISDAQVRVQCILECIRDAPVPWSEGTQAMCKLGLALNTTFSAQLEDQRRFVGLKLVLQRYSLHLINVDDPRNAEIMLKNILSRDEENVMEDALHVVATYRHLSRVDAYFVRALHLLKTKNLEGVKKLFLELNDHYQRQTCQRLIAYATQKLLISPRGQKCQDLHMALTGGMVALECFLRKWHHPTGMVFDEKLFAMFRNLHTLQAHYGIYPTLGELEDKFSCKKLLKDQVTIWYKECAVMWDNEEVSPSSADKEGNTRNSLVKGSYSNPLTYDHRSPFSDKVEENSWRGLNRLHRFASLLGIPKGDLLSLLASVAGKNNRYKEAVHICREIVTDPTMLDCTGVVHEVVKLIIDRQHPQIVSQTNSPLNSTALQERNASIKSHADLMRIIQELLCSAMTSAHPDLLKPLLELGIWCQLGETLYSQCHVEGVYTQTDDLESSNPYNIWKFSALFDDSSMPIEDGFVTSLMTETMDACVNSHHFQTESFIPYKSRGEEKPNLLENEHLISNLLDLISHLRERGQDLIAFSLCLLLTQHHIISGTQESLAVCIPNWQQVFTILLKIIGRARPDVTLAVSMLILLIKKDALKVLNELIKRFGFDYSRLIAVAVIGRDCCTLHGLIEVKEQFEVLLKRAQWGKRLADMNVSFKEAFKGEYVALNKVMGDLVSHPDCSFSILYDYCNDFSLDMTDALLCYLRITLHSWSPELPTEEIQPGELVQIEPPRAVLSKCQAIIAEINNKSLLQQMLITELDMLSSYNYELIELVLQQLVLLEQDSKELDMLKRGLDVVSFLQAYIRQALPSDTEVDEWVCNHPQSLGPPNISKYRLPFHELFQRSKSVMKIIEAELNVSNVDIWLQASHTMKLNADQLCMVATQNTVSRTLEQDASEKSKRSIALGTPEYGSVRKSQWQVHSSNSALLAHVRTVVSKIQHDELATACANWVVNRLPPGADKVEAAEKSKLLAKQWEEGTSDSKAAEAYIRMSDRHQQLAVEHALHKHNLAEPQYLALTRTPVELIFALYQHPSLDSLATLGTHSMPDISGCISDICNIVGCSQVSIQLDLLEKWLPPPESAEGTGVEDTVTNFKIALDPSSPNEDDPADDASLSRVIYLLRCCPQNEAVSYLLNRALSEDTSISAAHRLRALRCLLAIADEQTIQKHCPKSIASIRSFLQTMTYVSRLEALGHATSVQQFNSMDKGALVEGLWRSQRHNPIALTLLTDLCRDYKVTTASLWGAVLTQITNFVKSGQVDIATLERVLLQVKSMPHLWVVPALSTAWSTLINYPFTKASCPISESCLASCIHSVDLLLRHCPVAVFTAPLLRHCANLQLPVLALAIAAADQMESHNLQAMIDKTPVTTLKTNYQKLKSTLTFPKSVEDLLECLQ